LSWLLLVSDGPAVRRWRDLYWIIGLTIYVWVEKILPGGALTSRLMGAFLTLWGLGLLAGII